MLIFANGKCLNEEDLNYDYAIEAYNRCPHCDYVISPTILNTYFVTDGLGENIFVLYYCNNCKQCFLCKYSREESDDDYLTNPINIYPMPSSKKRFCKEISLVSPSFVNIYNETYLAEQMNLNSICGIGYRKALEYLIKDFACYITPDKEDDIKSDTRLSNVIANRIPDFPEFKIIKELSKSSWSLGCDYVHYDKQFTDYDLNDLKECIDLTATAIELHIKQKKYTGKKTIK